MRLVKAVEIPPYSVEDAVDRLRHAARRIKQAITWARAVNEAWRALNRHEARQDVADSHASGAAHVYERATLDAQIMMVSRVFDRPGRGHIMNQNRMSFPVCRELLALPNVIDHLLVESEGWNELGRENHDRILERYRAFIEGLNALETEAPNRVELIRGFRDENIAHELRFEVLPPRPQYDHIQGIVAEASNLTGHLALMVSGDAVYWQEGDIGRSADWLWEVVAEAQRRDD